jgi:hypothetical protein
VHPFERLRQAARADGEDPARVARYAAGALAGIAHEPAAVVTACRRLVEGQPMSGPVWWLAARVLAAVDPGAEAWRAAEDLRVDGTGLALAGALPEDTWVTVLGSPPVVGSGLRRRGDVAVLLVDALGQSAELFYDLEGAGTEVVGVAESGLGGAAASSSLVLLEADALGEGGLVAVAGSLAAGSVAHVAGVPVWAVAGVGRALPAALWQALVRRRDRAGAPAPWSQATDLVPAGLVDAVVGPEGSVTFEEAVAAGEASCPPVPELTR